ncbi:NAD(P)/FAD-dependent oxidoreductase [Panacagrimonas sp.]|uniref:NAD(P)/FAD-dependent oxidoreductase n=1 Tax=Panacagrimonas sp. TaxID=2480088 RepID=UPI003B51771D
MSHPAHHVVVIVGGGAAGATVASLLLKRRPDLDIAVVEPAETHWYQPAWTLVGAGAFDVAATGRPMASCLPGKVTWVRARASGFDPENNQVLLEDGRRIEYRFLVAAAGLQLDWHKIEGLEATLGNNGVTSNYRHDLAPYTWECIRNFSGGQALFTQPPMPIKCAGAPQKILYMAADHFRRRGLSAQLSFHTPGPAMFGVPFYSKALERVVAEYAIRPAYGQNLVAVDGPARKATFEVKQADRSERIEQPFEMLHVVPPQSAPDFIKSSPLADASGWVAVDKHSLRHARYDNVFGLGDCTTTPNSKTAAAVRAQAPVVTANLLDALEGREMSAKYDGYASCPLTTSVGKIMLAEFLYDGVPAPSFPLDPRIPRRAYWWLKKSYLPALYWGMLRGNLGLDWHAPRQFPEAVPAFKA